MQHIEMQAMANLKEQINRQNKALNLKIQHIENASKDVEPTALAFCKGYN